MISMLSYNGLFSNSGKTTSHKISRYDSPVTVPSKVRTHDAATPNACPNSQTGNI
jgi:hypothetical protein